MAANNEALGESSANLVSVLPATSDASRELTSELTKQDDTNGTLHGYPTEENLGHTQPTRFKELDNDTRVEIERLREQSSAHDLQRAKVERQTARAHSRGNVARTLRWPVGLAAGVAAFILARDIIFPGGNHASPPPPNRPSPEVAVANLSSADTLVPATGNVTDISNASVRFTDCTPFDLYCQDLHGGHDISTKVVTPIQFTVDGSAVHYGVGTAPDGKPMLVATIGVDKLGLDVVNPSVTHSGADSQVIAGIIGLKTGDSGISTVGDIATRQATSDLLSQTGNTIMAATNPDSIHSDSANSQPQSDFGTQPGDAVAGAISQAVRKDVRRLVELEKTTSPASAPVVANLIAEGRPIGIDFGANGFSFTTQPRIKDVHYSHLGFHLDVIFENAKNATLTPQAAATIASWLDSTKTVVIRHHPPLSISNA